MNGLEILSVEAFPRRNFTFPANPFFGVPEPIKNLDFCNVTITYTHPGWGDTINVISYLPFEEKWNGRFMANGGGGLTTGGESLAPFTMIPGLGDGFAVSTTDGGHPSSLADSSSDKINWALSSPGNVNWPLLVDFASVALHDMATIGKATVKAFYGKQSKFSYFFGASTGGRQGHMLAQRYPKDFDGIIAVCPAMNWPRFLFANIYPSFIMDKLKTYPRPCEFEVLRQAAIATCDGLDGLEDGIISRPDLCQFDPHSVVGKSFNCNGTEATFSFEAAEIALAAWNGPRSARGEFQWYGFGIDANITDPVVGAALTECNNEGGCTPVRFPISSAWIKYWILKDPDFDLSTINHEQWDTLFHASVNEYNSVIGTNDPNLSGFKTAGGKMVTWHGIADQAIPVNGSVEFYDRVLQVDPDAGDYYRFFLAPGTSHAMHLEVAPSREEMIKVIQDWVERNIAPETLFATGPGRGGATIKRNLCMYPRVQHYQGGDGNQPESFLCV